MLQSLRYGLSLCYSFVFYIVRIFDFDGNYLVYVYLVPFSRYSELFVETGK